VRKLTNEVTFCDTKGCSRNDELLTDAINSVTWNAKDKIVIITDDNDFKDTLLKLKDEHVSTVMVCKQVRI